MEYECECSFHCPIDAIKPIGIRLISVNMPQTIRSVLERSSRALTSLCRVLLELPIAGQPPTAREPEADH